MNLCPSSTPIIFVARNINLSVNRERKDQESEFWSKIHCFPVNSCVPDLGGITQSLPQFSEGLQTVYLHKVDKKVSDLRWCSLIILKWCVLKKFHSNSDIFYLHFPVCLLVFILFYFFKAILISWERNIRSGWLVHHHSNPEPSVIAFWTPCLFGMIMSMTIYVTGKNKAVSVTTFLSQRIFHPEAG